MGCIPSKSLVRSSGLAALETEASFEEKAEKYRLAIEEKRRLTDMLRRKNYGKLADNPNIDVILGKASFVSNTVVQIVTDQETVAIEGKRSLSTPAAHRSFRPSKVWLITLMSIRVRL